MGLPQAHQSFLVVYIYPHPTLKITNFYKDDY